MEKVVLVISAVCLVGVWCARKIPLNEDCPLCDYVYTDDGVYDPQLTAEWDLSNENHLQLPVTTYLFNLTALKYWEGGVQEPIWWSSMIINVPHTIVNPGKAFLMLAGLQHDQSVDTNDKELIGTAGIAARTGSITATLYHLPKDPVHFIMDPNGQYTDSDFAMAFTQFLFYNNPNQSPLILMQMPMTKMVIKAMDLLEDPPIPSFTKNPGGLRIVLGGESKRGWIAWLAAALDDRVEALIPVTAASFSKMDGNTHLMYKSFGGYAFFHGLGLHSGLFSFTDSPAVQRFGAIVDPLFYKKYLTMPKLVIIAASDDLFLPDASKLWFEEMPGENHFWALENRGHFLEFYPNYEEYWLGMGAYYATFLKPFSRPSVSWKLTSNEVKEKGKIVMFANRRPKNVTVFYADSAVSDRRDFRSIIFCATCPAISLCGTCPKMNITQSGVVWLPDDTNIVSSKNKVFGTLYRYRATYDFPETGYRAFFIQMKFDGIDGADLTFTSEVNIIPNTFPSPDCQGQACGLPSIPLV